MRGTSPADPMALAAVFLSFWGELSRQELAAELGVLPKTAAAAVQRVIAQVGAAGVL
jgi:DNA-directed RNA polymerase specialized sigma24 family protein